MGLWIPPKLATEYAEQRREHAAGVARQVGLGDELAEWNRILKEIDPHLQLVKASENATHPQLKPGYYHVIRANPDAPPSLIVHEGPNGEFREPDSGLLERLRAGDMWNDRAMRDQTKRDRKLQAAAQSRRESERAERMEELTDRIKAAWAPGVHIKKEIPA